MKKLNQNKLISVYILWIILQFFLWFFGGNWLWYSKYMKDENYLLLKIMNKLDLEKFYPFQKNLYHWYFDPRGIYDLSELLIYTLFPLLLFLAYKFWTKDNKID